VGKQGVSSGSTLLEDGGGKKVDGVGAVGRGACKGDVIELRAGNARTW